MVEFGNLDTVEGLKALDKYLVDASYIEGCDISGADLKVHGEIKPKAVRGYPNLARWFKHVCSFSSEELAGLTVTETTAKGGDDDFDADDLFGDDDDEEEAEALRLQQERAEAALKAKEERDAAKAAAGKKKEAAKSQILFDVKPWDDTTDLGAMEAAVRSIEVEGATWGAAQKKPIGYGINKLQILCTIVDDLVPSTEIIEELIVEHDDYVQSVDVAAFNKL